METANDYPVCSESPIGLKGPIRTEILKVVQDNMGDTTNATATTTTTPTTILDTAQAVVLQSFQDTYWDAFLASPQWLRCRHFLWYRDRPVVPNDFFVMRVLGRGGFGLVNGMCVVCVHMIHRL